MNSHSVEPELGRATPRPLRRKANGSGQAGIGCLRVFILPFIAVGVGMLVAAIWTTLVLWFGSLVPGTIAGRHTSYDSEDGTSYHLDYSFAMNGATYSASEPVSFNEYSSWPDGSTLNVRALPFAPGRGAQLQTGNSHALRHALFYWGFALFWNAVMSVFVWLAFIYPVIERRLVARGTPAIGRISDKKIVSGEDSDSYFLHYEYAPVDASPSGSSSRNAASSFDLSVPHLEGRTGVSQADYNAAVIGSYITVLFDARHPKRSLIYRFADWEVAT